MDAIETIFLGFGRIAEFIFGVFHDIEGVTTGLVILVIVAFLGGHLNGLLRSERGRGRYEAAKAWNTRNDYRQNGY